MESAVRVQRYVSRHQSIFGQLSHFFINSFHAELPFGQHLCKIFLQLIIGNFIAFLIASIIVSIFLYSIVGQMHHRILNIVYSKFLRTGPDIPFSMEIPSQSSMETCHHHIMSEIEFATFEQKRSFYIFLQNKSTMLSVIVFLSIVVYLLFYLFQIFDNYYSVASVTVFTWL